MNGAHRLLDVGDDQLVVQQQVFEELVLLLQGDGPGAEQAEQQGVQRVQRVGQSTGGVRGGIRETQRLQDAVLT
ncbi:hypothetical protein EYF80_032303 [Liparis tanakae]|uniref:Uncharacterized protein n=1 Tax=Liparis tanakae TaxID=230148 RepID=A0A4Z2GVK1_9TELE|nr:hypothetical protein EYF80_032303 [Liparis tanakae]